VEQARGKFAESQLSLASLHYLWLVASGCLYLLGMFPCCLFWQRTLRSMGQQPWFPASLRAFYIGHLGKYVPGKALVVVIRTGLIRGPRVDTAVAAASVFVETLTMMAVGAMVSALILALLFRQHQSLVLLAFFLAVAAGIPTLPPVFRRIVRLVQAHRASPQLERSLQGLNWSLTLSGWITIAAGWLLFGLSLWATLLAMPGVEVQANDYPLLTACVCLAMVAGFLSLLPGGIGVREFIVMQLLAPRFGPVVAIVSAVILRLVWLAAELILAGTLYLAIRPGGDFSERTAV
jgi:hypothetical protein